MKKIRNKGLGLLLSAAMLAQIVLPTTVLAEKTLSRPTQEDRNALVEAVRQLDREADTLPPSKGGLLPPMEFVKQMREKQAASLKDDTPVKVLVQLSEAPAVKSNKTEAQTLRGQEELIRKVTPWTVDKKIGRRVAYLVNGFGATVKRSDIPRLEALPGVLNVREMPVFYPTMASAVNLTHATRVWEQRHLKGEGMLISIIDTGIDTAHPDIRLSEDGRKHAKLSREKVESLIESEKLDGKYFTEKVPYGYDYADLDQDVKPGGSPHGQHVAGIAAANASPDSPETAPNTKGVTGVAPEAQLLAMKVFSDFSGGAMSIDIVAAIEDSVKLGADVINMSLGSFNGFYDDKSGYYTAMHNAIEKGVAIVVAAGNDGAATSSTGTTTVDLESRDLTTVASPATIPGVLAVASAENDTKSAAFAKYQDAAGKPGEFIYNTNSSGLAPDGKPHPIVYAGIGKPEQFPKNVAGKYALIMRGELTFDDKVKNARAAGATGVVIYNQASNGEVIPGMSVSETNKKDYFIAGAGHKGGQALADAIQAAGDKVLEVVFGPDRVIASEEKGRMSEFTSWGLTPELAFKPEVTAPGGHILSTLNDGKYGEMSGTSMASPHVAGATALLMQELKQREAAGAKLPLPMMGMVKTLFENTAQPLRDRDSGKLPYSPRQQGAGMIQIDKALESQVLAFVVDSEEPDAQRHSYGTVSLGELGDETSKIFKLRFVNFGTTPVTLTPKYDEPMTMGERQVGDNYYVKSEVAKGARISGPESVRIPAGGEVKEVFTLRSGKVKDNWVEGYLRFKANKGPNLSVPYVAYAGHWSKTPLFDKPFTHFPDNVSDYFLLMYIGTKNAFHAFMNGSTMLFFKQPFGETYPLGNFSPITDFNPAETAGISPANGDFVADNVYPQFGLMRSAATVRYEILDSEGKVIRVLDEEHNLRKNSLPDLMNDPQAGVSYNKLATWDGTISNPSFNPEEPDSEENPRFIPVPEGQYFYRLAGRATVDSEEEYLVMPVKVDNTAPRLLEEVNPDDPEQYEMVSDPTNPESKEKNWLRVRFKAEENGTGISAASIEVTGDEIESKNIRVKRVLKPVEGQENTYDLYLGGLPLRYSHDITINIRDNAFNFSEDEGTIELSVGDQGGIFLTPYGASDSAPLGELTFFALHPAAKAEYAALHDEALAEEFDPVNYPFSNPHDEESALFSTLWSELPEEEGALSMEDNVKDKYPVLIAVEGLPEADEGATVELSINGTKMVKAVESAEADYVPLVIPTDEVIPLDIEVKSIKDGKETILYSEKGERSIVLDSEPPKLNAVYLDKPMSERLEKVNVGTEDEPQYKNVLFVPDSAVRVSIKSTITDNSQSYKTEIPGYVIAAQYPDLGEFKFYNQGDDTSYETVVYVDWSKAPEEHSYGAYDRSYQGDIKDFYILRESDRGHNDQILKHLEEGYEDAVKPVPDEHEITFFNLDDMEFIGQEAEGDTYNFRGYSRGIDRVVIGGVSVKPEPRKEDGDDSGDPGDPGTGDPSDPNDPDAPKPNTDAAEFFTVPVKLENGFNKLIVEAFYNDKDGNEQRFMRRRYVVLYDTIAPKLELSEETKSHIVGDVILSNSDHLKISGVASDNTVGYTLYANGEQIFTSLDLAAINGMSAPFSHTVPLVQGGTLTLEVRDIFYADPKKAEELGIDPSTLTPHSYSINYPIIIETDKPTITWSANTPAEGARVATGSSGFSATATDKPIPNPFSDPAGENLEDVPEPTLQLFLNDAPYDGSAILVPGRYTLRAVARDAAGNETVETRTFLVSDDPSNPDADVNKDIVTFTDEASHVIASFYRGDLLDKDGKAGKRGAPLDTSKLKFHADPVNPSTVELTSKLADASHLLLWDVYFTDEDGDRIAVRSKSGIELRLSADGLASKNLKAKDLHAFYFAPAGEAGSGVLRLTPASRKSRIEQNMHILNVKHFSYYGLSVRGKVPKKPDPWKPSVPGYEPGVPGVPGGPGGPGAPGYEPGVPGGSGAQPGVQPGVQPGPQLGDKNATKADKPAADAVPKTGEKLPMPWMGMICALAALALLAARRPLLKRLVKR